MQIYAFVSDAFGGHGGIAVFSRDILTAFTLHPKVDRVIALPRVVSRELGPLPDKLVYRAQAANSAFAYGAALLKDLPGIARSDLLYCGHLNLAPLVKAFGRVFNIPVLGALYGIEAWTPSTNSRRSSAAATLDHYYSISAYTRDRFLDWSGVTKDRISMLPNAIHLDQYAPAEGSAELAARYSVTNCRVLLTFGRLVSRERAKGFDEVLDVLPALLLIHPDIKYIIAGDGPDRHRLEERVAVAGLQDHVVFTGFVDEAEKSALYGLADLYVMPSRGEGFGFVFLEAMACGVPVVASTVDGSRDAVRDGLLGAMVDPDDPGALESAIIAGLDAPKTVPEGLAYFSFPKFVQRVHDIVDRVVKQ
uniref:glycosyltransferase family 4 protein n=1 Tax=Pararhizobium sp. IMCC3301 TaxID=3067904 RepID=UPI002741B358|nr:glycosyltransferase family 4 protein [Pararhizobium sp. IMCC3301]